jgi:hypothetical protein
MSQDTEKYLHFNVALLKDSFALDALRRDALKYHMVDQPGQLTALRLTEYYELMSGGILATGASAPAGMGTAAPGRRQAITSVSFAEDDAAGLNPDDGDLQASDEETIVSASPDVEQNADEAAEYWSRL